MPKQESRVQKAISAPRVPLTATELLVHALNGETLIGKRPRAELDSRMMVLLVKRFQELDSALQAAKREWTEEDILSDPGLAKLFRALNRLLARYRLTPIIWPREVEGEKPSWKMLFGLPRRSQPFIEFARVQTIEKLASEGRIASLKRCSQCSRWLFARFPHQRFCSATCKETFHRSDPGDKQRRRDWARNNYQIHKTKNVK